MAQSSIVLTHGFTKQQLIDQLKLNAGAQSSMESLRRLSIWLKGQAGGTYQQNLVLRLNIGAVAGSAVMTVSSTGSVNNETMVLAGVTFTAKTSGATGDQFNISATPTTQAANMVAAFNASANLAGIVTAANVAGVITITAVVPGIVGNALVVTESLTNVVVTTSFATAATGVDGTIYTLDLT